LGEAIFKAFPQGVLASCLRQGFGEAGPSFANASSFAKEASQDRSEDRLVLGLNIKKIF
jgi:hypothetical protein